MPQRPSGADELHSAAHSRRQFLKGALGSSVMLVAACAPGAAPAPTSAPAAAPTSAPAKPAATTAPGATAAPAAPKQQAPATTSDTKALSRTKATIATVSSSWTVLMVPYLALDKGWWKEAGLTEPEVKVVGPGATHVAAVIGGSIDFSVNLNTEGTARANAKGDKIFGIAGSTNKPNYALFAKGQGIDRVEDLKGKSIATDTPGGAAEHVVIEILQGTGLKTSDVTLVPVAGTIEEREKAMLTGAVTAALGSVSDFPTLKTQGVKQLATLADVRPDYQFALTVSRGDILDENPDTTVAFLKGMIRGFEYIQDPKNNAEMANILKSHHVRVDDEHWDDLMDIQRKLMTPDGRVNERGVEVVVNDLKESGDIPKDYNPKQVLRLDHLKQAQSEMGIKI